MNQQPTSGKLRRSWEITKSAWRVLKLDKELAILPVLSFLTTIGVLLTIGVAALMSSVMFLQFRHVADFSSGKFSIPNWASVIILVVLSFIVTLIANFFAAALIFGATQRFNGIDPTVRGSLAGARKKFYPLALFSLMMTTVGLILQALEERVPFAGRIAVWLVSAAWNIANVFAIPVIVLSEGTVMPFAATRSSVQIIKKVWGESVIVNAGVGIAGLIGIVIYVLIFGLVGVGAASLPLSIPGVIGGLFIGLGIAGLLLGLLILTALSAIIKSALYHYALTGEAPEFFSHELLHSAITPKKARRIFS